jgi:hypothetical protein
VRDPNQSGDVMLVATNQNGTLGFCYSNKYIETYLRDNLTDADKEKIRDPKQNYFTLYEKPLATLNITGWGRTPQLVWGCTLLQLNSSQRHGRALH